MIQRIEMVNFKSYYGKQVIGPFHKVLPRLEHLHTALIPLHVDAFPPITRFVF